MSISYMCTMLITMKFKMGERYKNIFVKLERGWGVSKFGLGLVECEWLSWVPRHISIWIVSFKIPTLSPGPLKLSLIC